MPIVHVIDIFTGRQGIIERYWRGYAMVRWTETDTTCAVKLDTLREV